MVFRFMCTISDGEMQALFDNSPNTGPGGEHPYPKGSAPRKGEPEVLAH